jgi:hypothetical protein
VPIGGRVNMQHSQDGFCLIKRKHAETCTPSASRHSLGYYLIGNAETLKARFISGHLAMLMGQSLLESVLLFSKFIQTFFRQMRTR